MVSIDCEAFILQYVCASCSPCSRLVGAVVLTAPALYLVSGQTQTGTGHNHGHAAHESHGSGAEHEVDTLPEEVKKGAGEGKEESGNDDEGKGKAKNATPLDQQDSKNYEGNAERKSEPGKKDEKDISPEGKDNDSGDPARKSDKKARPSGEDEGSDTRAASPEGINFKGGEKKREEDAKGGTKIRIDSDLGKNIGEGASSSTGDAMSQKQRGYSSTDTRHSVDVSSDPEKSKKGEFTSRIGTRLSYLLDVQY